jgi:SAM-dependent methyltransferase
VEPNPDMWVNYEGSNVILIKEPLEEVSEFENKFDVIFAFEVLEHLLYPEILFSNAASLLKMNGTLIFSTPNSSSIEVTSMKAISNTLDIEHISIMSPLAIHSLANRHGFRIVKIETPGKFDMELMQIKFRKIFLKILFKRGLGARNIQEYISKYGFSSHMKIVLEKIK